MLLTELGTWVASNRTQFQLSYTHWEIHCTDAGAIPELKGKDAMG